MRDHQPIAFEQFNGFWDRGQDDSVPKDHFIEGLNVRYFESGYESRDGISPFIPRMNGTRAVVRMYTFNVASDGIITLDNAGNFYHVIPATNTSTLILSLPGVTDFTMAITNGRAYINPIGIATFLYVYNGNGTTAHKAGGNPPTNADGALAAANSGSGNVEAGIHIFGVVYETSSGFLTQIGPDFLPTVNAPGNNAVLLTSIPISPDPNVIARHIVASKFIVPAQYNGNTRGYELFFVPGGKISDNTTTSLSVNFFDSQLLASAAGLLDIASSVANGTGLCLYHNRLVLTGTPTINAARVSNPGEFEAFSNLDGFVQVQNDGLGLLNGQEYRDVLYLFKINETVAFTDNGNVPSSWPMSVIDEGLGAGIHGVCYIDTRQGMSSEYLLLENYTGIFMFNGTFIRSELSFKIRDYWLTVDQIDIAQNIEFYNDVYRQSIILNIPGLSLLLVGDYANGMTPEAMRWTKWTYSIIPRTITLFDKSNKLLIGSQNTSFPNKDGIYQNDPAKVDDVIYTGDAAADSFPIPVTSILYLVGDSGPEDILHFGGVRLRVIGSGNLGLEFRSLDRIDIQTLAPLPLSSATAREPTRLSNFTSQRGMLIISTNQLGAEFRINRVIVFAKQLWTQFPG